jgi:hypothetical protein
VRRIWAGIRVKCGNHDKGCAWIGSVADYKSHTARCINDMKSKIKLSVLKRHNADLLEEILEKNNEMNKLRISMRKLDPKALGLFNDSYDFKREDVVKLSQLISVRLENRPSYIDPNRIFNCIQNCFRDWEAGYNDNPEYYTMDMKMLLATCHASAWFSDNQQGKIREFLSKF